MCGRYTLTHPGDVLQDVLEDVPEDRAFGRSPLAAPLEALFRPRYNIAPTQPILAVRERACRRPAGPHRRELVALRWGLVPAWTGAPTERPLINARVETLVEKPSFRESLRARRCLVPADGFFEWRRRDSPRRAGASPWYFRLQDGGTFAFAGLWDRCLRGDRTTEQAALYETAPESALESCCIVTTDANPLVARVHDRMPVMLPRERWDLWLDPTVEDANALLELLVPLPPELMDSYRVGPLVNRATADDPRCIAPELKPPENLTLF